MSSVWLQRWIGGNKPDKASEPGKNEKGLILSDVSLSFGGVQALEEVSFRVTPGAVHSIIGPNGAGKTTLLNCISGRYRPAGSIRFDGMELTAVRPHRRVLLGIARTFQNLALFPELSVLDNVLVGAHHRLRAGTLRQCLYWTPLGCRREEVQLREEARQLLDLVGLAGSADQPAGQLAYGQQKRVELARALLAQPRMLLMDEPMAGMTQAEKQQLGELVVRLSRQQQITVVMIEHDMAVVRQMASHVVVLDFGRKIAEGTPAEVMAHPAVRQAYLGQDAAN